MNSIVHQIITNQLDHVDDNAGYTANFADDIDDQNTNNYTYTEIGELESDVTGGIASIEWRVDGKVKKVTRTTLSANQTQLEFEYDAFGRRILKISKPCSGGVPDSDQTTWTFTYYVNDASGNVMATYDYERQTDYYSMKLDEQMIYGSSRLGMRKYNILLSTFNRKNGCYKNRRRDKSEIKK